MSRDIYKALGRLKDPSAAMAVAERLGDFFDRDEAEACLRQMGPVAEEALAQAIEKYEPRLVDVRVSRTGQDDEEPDPFQLHFGITAYLVNPRKRHKFEAFIDGSGKVNVSSD